MRLFHFHFRNDMPLENCTSLSRATCQMILHTKKDNVEGRQALEKIILDASSNINSGRKIYHFYKINIFDINKNPFIVFCKENDIERIEDLLSQLKNRSSNPFENYSFIKEHMYQSTDINVFDKRNKEFCTCNDKFIGETEDTTTTKFLYKNIRLHKNFFVCDDGWFGFFYTKARFDAVTRCLAADIEYYTS